MIKLKRPRSLSLMWKNWAKLELYLNLRSVGVISTGCQNRVARMVAQLFTHYARAA